jgi:hypothetical protein
MIHGATLITRARSASRTEDITSQRGGNMPDNGGSGNGGGGVDETGRTARSEARRYLELASTKDREPKDREWDLKLANAWALLAISETLAEGNIGAGLRRRQ